MKVFVFSSLILSSFFLGCTPKANKDSQKETLVKAEDGAVKTKINDKMKAHDEHRIGVFFRRDENYLLNRNVKVEFDKPSQWHTSKITATNVKVFNNSDRAKPELADSFPEQVYGPVNVRLSEEYPYGKMVYIDFSSREGYQLHYKYFNDNDGKFQKNTKCIQYYSELWNNGKKGAEEAKKKEALVYKTLLPKVVKVGNDFQVEDKEIDWETLLMKINREVLKGHSGLFKMLTQPTEREKAYHKNFDGAASIKPYLLRYSDMLNNAGCWWGPLN